MIIFLWLTVGKIVFYILRNKNPEKSMRLLQFLLLFLNTLIMN